MRATQPTVSTWFQTEDGQVTIELAFPVTRSEFAARDARVMKTHEPAQDPQAIFRAGSTVALGQHQNRTKHGMPTCAT